jgi:hypothetical protein
MPVLRDPSPRARQRFEAYMTLVNISGYTELSLAPYLVRVLLTMPKDEEEYGFVYLDDLQPRSSTVSPLFAYLIYKKYDGTAGLDKYKQAYADKAKVFLSGQEKLPSSSLSDLVAELDITIDGIGKKLCAKYDKVEPELGRVPVPFKPGDMSLP